MSRFRRVKPIRQMVDVFFLPSLHGWDSLRPAMAAETAQTDNPEAAAPILRRKDICDFSDFVDRKDDARTSDLVFASIWCLNILGGILKCWCEFPMRDQINRFIFATSFSSSYSVYVSSGCPRCGALNVCEAQFKITRSSGIDLQRNKN